MHIVSKQVQANPQTPNNNAILLEGVSVLYRLPREQVSGIKEFAIRWLQRRVQYEDLWALRKISFSIMPGEAFGIIGRNGSGKSTLLKVIARVLIPTEGRVVVRGKLAPLLELGGGFHPELTGRENVYMNRALLGYSRLETEKSLAEIIEFSELEDFIDAPLRTYSTGMVARLGFAVATANRPDILLADEVLSVGDSAFQAKCLERMRSFQRNGSSIILVSHSMATVESFCERALWLRGGQKEALGPADEVARQYAQMDRALAEPAIEQTEAVLNLTSSSENALEEQLEFASLNEIGNIYPAKDIFDPAQGTVSFWMKFHSSHAHPAAVIFHTDDSRYVIYSGSFYSEKLNRETGIIVARAGGNRRSFDTYYGTYAFPDVLASLDDGSLNGTAFPEDEWHLVTMIWEGYPQGKLQLYLDAWPIGEHFYDKSYDDGRPLPEGIAIGMRPTIWAGELVHDENGGMVDMRPQTMLSTAEAGIVIHDMRLYRRVLSSAEVAARFYSDTPPA